jgi:predicted ATPase with chaperone activity
VVTKYQKRISGPLLDRIDIHIEVPRADYEKLGGDRLGESSGVIRARVQAARDIQRARFAKLDSKHAIFCNADIHVGEIRQFCKLQDEGQSLMRAAMSELNLSARAYHRILKLAHDCRLGRKRGDSIGAFCRGTPVSAEVDVELGAATALSRRGTNQDWLGCQIMVAISG